MATLSGTAPEEIKKLDEHLGNHPYVSGEAFPNEHDFRVVKELKQAPCKKTYPNVFHWYHFASALTPQVQERLSKKHDAKTKEHKGAAKETKAKETPAEKKEEEDFDLFDAPAPAAKTEAKKPAPVKDEPKKKKAVIAKSILVFDVKVFDTETDLQKLADKVYEIQMDGLVWNKEPKFLEVAFGIKKLQVGCVIEDDKVSTEDLFNIIEGWEDEVQSTDVVTMQKL